MVDIRYRDGGDFVVAEIKARATVALDDFNP